MREREASTSPVKVIGRYALHDVIASGGMATVHFGRLMGPVGFARTVAIKRLHEQYSQDPEFMAMFMDEARVTARIRHPNVVSTLDVVPLDGELFVVMEYVQGESLSRLFLREKERGERVPLPILNAILTGALHGLHSAHEATSEAGEPLGIVHRDVSPQNILVGVDGVPRVLDFGVAKAAGRATTTKNGELKGKLSYMAPEQLRGEATRATDVFAVGVVLWEGLTGTKLYAGDNDAVIMNRLLKGEVPPPSSVVPGIPPELDAIALKALARDPAERFPTAREMARMLEKVGPLASTTDVGEWVETRAQASLASRSAKVARIERESPADMSIPDIAVISPKVSESSSSTKLPTTGRSPSRPIPFPGVTDGSEGRGAYEIPATNERTRRHRRLAAVVGILLFLVLVVVFFVARRPAQTSPKVAAPSASSVPRPVGSPAPEAPKVAPAWTADPVVRAVDAGASKASASPNVPPRQPPSPTGGNSRSSGGRRPDCAVPYYVDANNVRHYRRECLH